MTRPVVINEILTLIPKRSEDVDAPFSIAAQTNIVGHAQQLGSAMIARRGSILVALG
jgi:hypothetical protein